MSGSLTVLHVEDDFADAMLFQHAICDGGGYDVDLQMVRTLRDARMKLSRRRYDLIVLDLRLPDSRDPNETVSLISDHADGAPILVLTGSAGVDAEAIGPDITVLDKNAFFHNRDDRKSRALFRRMMEATDSTMSAEDDPDALIL